MPVISIPPPYRGPTRGQAEVLVRGQTVRECLDALEVLHPGFRPQVLGPDGSVHRFVQLFVDGDQIEPTALDTEVTDDTEIAILAAIAGG